MKTLLLLAVLCLPVLAAEPLPVDNDIAEHVAHAEFLKKMKDLFQKNTCTLLIGERPFNLSAGNLRGNGIVAAVSDTHHTDVLPFYKAPKPEMLRQVYTLTIRKNVNRVFVVSSQLVAGPNDTDYTHLQVTLNEPKHYPDGVGWMYEKTGFTIPLDVVKAGVKTKVKTLPPGGSIQVTCEPVK